MKVSKLIEWLSKCDQEHEVYLHDNLSGDDFYILSIMHSVEEEVFLSFNCFEGDNENA